MTRWVIAVAILVASFGINAATEPQTLPTISVSTLPPLPQWAPETHLGNVTCGNAFCHESSQPWKTGAVLQNEYVYWESHDPHAKSYKTLKGKKSQEIAAKLKIADPAKESLCLDCHANNVPEARRARTFDIQDGVSCEACHGPAGKWLGVHVSGAGYHADNVANGMYPTDDALARAELCASCHVGNAKKFITHDLYGAGHPRTPFELNTYTNTGAHFVVNDQYEKRKQVVGELKSLAIGQLMTLRNQLDAIADPSRFHPRMVPELAFFDCYSCHRELPAVKEATVGSSLAAFPKLDHVNTIVISSLIEVTDPALAEAFQKQSKELQLAPQKSVETTENAAKGLRTTVNGLLKTFSRRDFKSQELPLVLSHLTTRVASLKELTPPAAEQTVLAVSTLLQAMKKMKSITDAQYTDLQGGLRSLRKIIDANSFDARAFLEVLSRMNVSTKISQN